MATEGDHSLEVSARGVGAEQGRHVQAEDAVRLTAWVRGSVQGVGFRWWTRCRGLQMALVGTASNRSDGSVEVVAEGPVPACEQLLAWLEEQPTSTGRPGEVTGVTHQWSQPRGELVGFRER
jgi:acylphosphatase